MEEIKPFEEILKAEGWAEENIRIPFLKTGTLHVIYTYHPVSGSQRSPSVAAALLPLSP